MIDFSKFGFAIKEEDETASLYTGQTWLEIQYWKKPNIYIIHISREYFIQHKDDYDYIDEVEKGNIPKDHRKVRAGISEAERKMAKLLMNSNFYVYPLFVGEIKDETFFEILINAICTDAEKLIQCGS